MRPLIVGIGGTTRHDSTTEKALRLALGAAEARGAVPIFLGGERLLFPMYEPDSPDRTEAAEQWVEPHSPLQRSHHRLSGVSRFRFRPR